MLFVQLYNAIYIYEVFVYYVITIAYAIIYVSLLFVCNIVWYFGIDVIGYNFFNFVVIDIFV
jgi:hypothetical protein